MSFRVLRARSFGGPTSSHPGIHLGELALPKAPDTMGGKPLVVDPTVNGVRRYAKMRGNFTHGEPAVPGFGLAVWSRHESTIVAKSRDGVYGVIAVLAN